MTSVEARPEEGEGREASFCIRDLVRRPLSGVAPPAEGSSALLRVCWRKLEAGGAGGIAFFA